MKSFNVHLDWINGQESLLLQRVENWVNINTYSWNTEGLNRFLQILDSTFSPLGGESEIINLRPQESLNFHGKFDKKDLGKALIIRKRPQAPLKVLFGGHIDTVFTPTSPFQTLKKQSKDIWIGPGVSDMKGGIAILLTTLEAFERSPFAQQLGWEILLTPDEEIGSPGSAYLYEEAAKRHQVGLLFEPSFSDGAFVSERKGSATYTIIVKGKAAHVGRDFTQGKSSVFALSRFISKLESLLSIQDLTVNVADVEGKGPVNIVPPLATCLVNFRSMSSNNLHDALEKMEQFRGETEEEGISIEMHQNSIRSPKPFNKATQKLFEAYSSCASDLNLPFQIRSTGGVCDGNILAGAGLPTLDTAGVIGGALHTHEEYLNLPSLIERSKLAALFLFKLSTREIVIQKELENG